MTDAIIGALGMIIDGVLDAAVVLIAIAAILIMGVVELLAAALIPIWIAPYLIIKRRRENGKSRNL